MTELSFLIDLLLNGRLQKSVQEKVTTRIREVEEQMQAVVQPQQPVRAPKPISAQSPSTIAALERQAGEVIQQQEPIASTVAASQALMQRQALIAAATKQKPLEVDTGNGSKGPRKF